MMDIRFNLPLAFSLLLAAQSMGQDLTMRLSHPTISQDRTVDLTFTVTGNSLPARAPGFVFPDGITSTGISKQQSTRTVNGRRTSTASFTYSLRAERPGRYTIGPYSVNWNGQPRTLPAMSLEVTPARPLVTIESSLSHTNVYTDQNFELTLLLLSELPIHEISIAEENSKGIEFGSFRKVRVNNVVREGTQYFTEKIAVKARAVHTGALRLDPELRVTMLDQQNQQRARSFFNVMAGRPVTQTIRVSDASVNSQDVPEEGKPASYAGAVGKFRLLDFEASPTELQAGDPITTVIKIYGEGNMRSVLPPSYQDNDDFQVYDPILTEDRLNEDGTGGYRTYEQVVIPRHAGTSELPAIHFSYFNPETHRYHELTKPPIPLTVTPTAQRATKVHGTVQAETSPDEIEASEGLVYLKPLPPHPRKRPLSRPQLLGLSGAPGVLWALLLLISHQRRKQNSDIGRRRKAVAPKVLRAAIRDLERLHGDEAAFHATMWHALHGYFANRFNLSPGDVSPATIQQASSLECTDPLLRETNDWFTRTEAARFASGTYNTDTTRLLQEFIEFTNRWEKHR